MSEVKRELNLFQMVAVIVGLVIGSGVFINIAPVQRAGITAAAASPVRSR